MPIPLKRKKKRKIKRVNLVFKIYKISISTLKTISYERNRRQIKNKTQAIEYQKGVKI